MINNLLENLKARVKRKKSLKIFKLDTVKTMISRKIKERRERSLFNSSRLTAFLKNYRIIMRYADQISKRTKYLNRI